MFSKIKIYLFSAFLLFIAIGCEDSPVNSPLCTAEFVTVTLQVTGPNGEPIENADISVVNSVSNDTLNVCENFECAEGMMGNYTIFHDGFIEKVSFEGDSYTVSGTSSEGSFQEEFVFARNECHVFKKSGPETVTLGQ